MSQTALGTIVCALAVIVFTAAASGPLAVAAPDCKNKTGKHAACTDKLKARTARKAKGESGAGMKEMQVEKHKNKIDD